MVFLQNYVNVKRPKTDYSYNINVIIIYKIVQLAFLTMCMRYFYNKFFFSTILWKKLRWYDFCTTMNILPNIERRGGSFLVPP